MKCEWCAGGTLDPERPEDLCRAHVAEYEGLSENELDRRDEEERMELE